MMVDDAALESAGFTVALADVADVKVQTSLSHTQLNTRTTNWLMNFGLPFSQYWSSTARTDLDLNGLVALVDRSTVAK